MDGAGRSAERSIMARSSRRGSIVMQATCRVSHLVVRFRLAAFLLALASPPLLAAAASPMRPGLWELSVSTVVDGQSQPMSTARECISQADIDHDTKTLPRPDGDCKLSDIVTNGARTMYDMVCKVDNITSRGRMDITMGSDRYDGKTNMVISGIGTTDVPMTIVISAKRTGDCSK
jgi:hypothetical protein